MEKTSHSTPNGAEWTLSQLSDGRFQAVSGDLIETTNSPSRTLNQFCADLTRKYPGNNDQSKIETPVFGPVSGNWEHDKLRKYKDKDGDQVPYCAHWVPPTPISEGRFEGPDDAYLWFGQPYEGNPWVNKLPDPNNDKAKISVQPFVDQSKISQSIGGVALKWIAWDSLTGCNVYERLNS